jgi:hypothetical protein
MLKTALNTHKLSSHAIRKGEYGKQLKVLTGTNGESKIRKQPINLSEMYENNNELEIKDATNTDRSASYLGLHLEIDSEACICC